VQEDDIVSILPHKEFLENMTAKPTDD